MQRQFQDQLINFIREELNVEPEAIALAQRQVQLPFQLPISLWQYGLISLEGVNKIWSWIEARSDQDYLSPGQCS